MLVSRPLLAAIGLLTTLVVAAPVSVRSFDDTDTLLEAREPRKLKEALAQYVHTVKTITEKLRPKEGQSVLWSGRRKGNKGKAVDVKTDAQVYAKEKGKRTLEQSLKKLGITIPKTNPHAHKLWEHASRTYASRSKGPVDAILGTDVRPNSVWHRIEKPVLDKNDKVPLVTDLGRGKNNIIKGGDGKGEGEN